MALSGITPVSSVHWGHFVWSSTTRSSDQPVHLELSYKLKEQHVASGDLFHLVVALYFCKVQHGSTGKQKANRNVAIRRQQTVRQMCGAADLILSALKASSRTDEETPLYSLEQITKIFTFASNYFCLFVCFPLLSCLTATADKSWAEGHNSERISRILCPFSLSSPHQPSALFIPYRSYIISYHHKHSIHNQGQVYRAWAVFFFFLKLF